MKKIGLLLVISMALFGCKPDALDKPFSEEKILMINELSGQVIDNVLEDAFQQGVSLDTLVLFNQLKEIDGVKSIRFNLAGTGISVQLKDGSENHFFLAIGNDGRWFANTGGKSPVPEKKPDTKALDPNYIVPMGNKRALLLAPFEFQTTGTGNNVDYASVFNTLTDAGFQVDSFMNKNANLQRFRGEYLSQYDVVLMHTHGGVLYNKKTNEDYTVLVTGTLYEGNYAALSKEEKERVELVTIGSTLYLAVTPSWFEYTLQTEFNNAWVFVTGCQTTLVDDLYKKLFALGVEGYNGFNVTVSFSSADAFMNDMVSRFTSALSFKQASSQTADSTPIEEYSALWQAVFGHLQTAVTQKRFDAEQKTENTPFYLIVPAGLNKKPRVVIKSISEKSHNHAEIISEVEFEGAAKVTARGVCWSTSENPTIADAKTENGTGIGTYTSNITGLTPNTTYYVRAYATNAEGTAYGQQNAFTTSEVPATQPTVTTGDITDITTTTASCPCEVTDDGGAEVTVRGVCWSTSENPTTEDYKTKDGTGTGKYSSNIASLTPNTTYYVRAYATNSEGTAYGEQKTFTTSEEQKTLPTVTTGEVTDITTTTASCTSEVIDDGGAEVTARGVCWSTSEDPTTTEAKTEDGTGIGTYTSNITSLTPNTTYYVRAYATNAEGTAYGEQKTFTTSEEQKTIPTVITEGYENVTTTTASCFYKVTHDGGTEVTARGVCWSSSVYYPTTEDSKTEDGTGIGAFTSNITNLIDNTTYYVRAYATNSEGTAYGQTMFFKTIKQERFAPTVTTGDVTDIGITTASCSYEVTDDGGAEVTVRGVCWSKSENPTIKDKRTLDGTGIGIYTSNITGLTHNTTYYVRAYAANSEGVAYGEQKTFLTLDAFGYYTDVRDGYEYKTIQIGSQTWLAENLRYLPKVNGPTEPIRPHLFGNELVAWYKTTLEPHYYVYGYDGTDVEAAKAHENYTTYGVLYNWVAAVAGKTGSDTNPSGVQGICPEGWHLPSDKEWEELREYLGDYAGGHMKAPGTTLWGPLKNPENRAATNSSYFTALPGGYRTPSDGFGGIFSYIRLQASWWSSTEHNNTESGYRYVYYNHASISGIKNKWDMGYSVRCVKD